MSSKGSPIKRDGLPKPESMLTRRKSALMKRQLRQNDDSIRKISQITSMLRSPSKDKNVNKSKKANLKSSPKNQEKKGKANEKEFYPEKLKRKIKSKKVVLKPQTELKVIGNKRKLAVPLKGVKSPPVKRHRRPTPREFIATSPSMLELVELDSLDDEGFLEILTCESPVWWEDPPNESYTEEAVFISPSTSIESGRPKSNKNLLKCDQTDIDTIIKIPETKQNDDKFMKKRTTLESLLGNIKNKLTVHKDSNQENCLKDKIDIGKEKPQEIETIDSVKDNTELSEKKKEDRLLPNKEKNIPESMEEGPLLNDDMLKDLENTEIPIEETKTSDVCVVGESSKDTSSANTIEDNCKGDTSIVIEDSPERTSAFLEDKEDIVTTDCLRNSVVSLTSSGKQCETDTIQSYSSNSDCSSKKESMNNFQELSITSIDKLSSPTSLRSLVSDDTPETSSLVSNQDNVDTISDTNIRFLEDECKADLDKNTDLDEKNQFFLKNNTDGKSKNVKSRNLDKAQLMTVYKIITNDKYRDSYEDKSIINTTLNSVALKTKSNNAKCKNKSKIKISSANVDRDNEMKAMVDVEFKENKFNRVSDDDQTALKIVSDVKNAKYCLKCSSIFETEFCLYCVKRANVNNLIFNLVK